MQIDPAHLDLLQQRGVISPEAAAIAKARALSLDGRLGLPAGQGFANMFTGGQGPEAPPAQAAPQAFAPPPPVVEQAKQAKAKPPKLTPEQVKAADTWVALTKGLEWANPKEMPLGSTFSGVQARKMPAGAKKLLEEMYPEQVKAGMVPMGWTNPDKLPPEQKALLAQLILMGNSEGQQQPAPAQQPLIAGGQ